MRGHDDTMMRDSGWGRTAACLRHATIHTSVACFQHAVSKITRPYPALRLVRGYENIVPPARFSVASSQASSFYFCRFFNSSSRPVAPKGKRDILIKNLMYSIQNAKLIAAYFPEIELVYSTLLVLLGRGAYDSCDRITWRVLPTFP